MQPGKKQLAYEGLKLRVLTLDIAPGAPLDEATLSERYGLSRTPLREVFQRLSGEGYISIEANRGAAVSSMDLAVMRNFFQTAPMVYAAVARLATEHATSAQIVELKKIQSRFRRAVSKNVLNNMVFCNHNFHELLGQMAANPYLQPSLSRLLIDHTRMSQTFYQPRLQASRARIDDACNQHDEMIEAIEQRIPARTVELTLQHWELSRGEIEHYVRPDPLPIDGFDTHVEATHDAV